MKVSFLLSFFTALNLSAAVYSQDARMTIDVQGKSVLEVIRMIEKQSSYRFFFSDNYQDLNRLVSFKVKDKNLSEILADMLGDKAITYRILENNIVVITPVDSEKQQYKISGTVTDATNGEPIIGANIIVEGTTLGTTTDVFGKFSMDIPNPSSVVLISFLGYITERITLGENRELDIKLVPDIKNLEEVVVVGYGTQKRVNVTGSVSTLDGKKIERVPVANASNTLVGRLPGLIAVNRSGEPGYDDASLSIRGFSNMLVIVDGVEQPFNQIDANEIENISILKDASASIYGARAGNGVVLVTTKRGKSGKPKISFNAFTGFQSPVRFPELVDAATYAKMYNDAEISAGRAAKYSDTEIEKYRNGTDPAYPNTNWYKETFRSSAPISQYNLNTLGGGEQMSYFFSMGYLNQDGLLRSGDTKYKRYNIRSNIDAKITQSFSVSLDLSGRIEQRDFPGASISSIMEGLYFANPTFPASFPDPSKPAFIGKAGKHPVAWSDKDFSGYTDDNRKFFTGIMTFKYQAPFLKGLAAKAVFNYNANYNYTKNWQKAITAYNYDYANKTYSVASVFGKNQLDENINRASGMTSQVFVTYDKEFGKHTVNATLVGEYIENGSNYFGAHREGYITTAIDQLFAGEDLNKDNNGSAYQDGRIGYAARLNYSFAGKYLAEATMRYDASARFMDTNRWGYFPGLSLGWRISEESFLKGINQIDNLKLRLSYGEAGNDYVGQFNYLTGYYFSGNAVFGDNASINKGIVSKGLANPDLTWERTATSNIGLDGSFWKGLLSFEFDYFYRKVTDVPGYRNQSLPSTFGASLPQENINSYDDRGFELVLNHSRSLGKFTYNIGGNISYARSKWIHYDEPVYTDEETRNRRQLSGQWRNRWFGYEAVGLFQNQDEINNWPVDQDNNGNVSIKPGDIKYLDYNKDGKLDFKDEHVIGRGTTPEIIFGINAGCQYAGFDFAMLWQGGSNFNAYFSDEVQNPFFNGETPFAFQSDYWTPQNKGAKYPRMYPGGATNNKYTSTYWLQDATYIRLKNLQLGYTIPKKLLSKVSLEAIRIYFSGYNLLTIDDVYPFDPETGTSRGWYYPQQKSYSVGINLTF